MPLLINSSAIPTSSLWWPIHKRPPKESTNSSVVWFGATDRAKAWIQGNARVRRPGQKYPSTCFQLVSNKLEEEIFDRLENNTSMQGLMLDAIRKGEF